MTPATETARSPHPERFFVEYILEANGEAQARQLARELCLEQTVELPDTLDQVHKVEAYTVGAVDSIEDVPGHTSTLFRATVAFPNATAGNELTQFLNVVFGNTSLKKGVSVANVTLSQELQNNREMFPGPRFGIEGLRELVGTNDTPLLCTALKPMGASSQEFAQMAYQLARGGIHIIKDDHGLANQVWAPFQERVTLCAAAVQRANQETGQRCLYAPCLNAPHSKFLERARYAKQVGAGAVLVLPGIAGWDSVRTLAADPTFNLPILVHPALLGGWLDTDDDDSDATTSHIHHPHGFSHAFLFGLLPRLCGGDAVIFPNAGGRFQFTPQECLDVAQGCRRPMGQTMRSVLPCPAGGMKLNRVQEMRSVFGNDTLFLIGGDLLKQSPDLEANARLFAHHARDGNVTPTLKMEAMCTSTDSIVSIENVELVAMKVRRRVLEYTLYNNGGYLSQACSSAETLATLYLRALNLGKSIAPAIPGPFRGSPGPTVATITGEGFNGDPNDPTLDRLIFSPVHYALVLYSLLVEVGRLSIEAFQSYNKDGSTVELIGAEHSPGHAVTAGSLAQAFSQAAGIAFARKLKGHTGRVICYMSDGECQEGQFWECVQTAVFHKISMVTLIDVNGQQCDGENLHICNLAHKLRAFGALVHEVDGHNVTAVEEAVKSFHATKPTIVLCYTDPCKGFPLLKKRAPNLHYVRFKDEQEKMIWEEVLQNMDTEIEERQRNVAFQAKEKPNGNVLLIISDDTNKKRPAVDLLEKQLHFKKRCEGLAAGTRASNVESLPTKTSIEMVTRPHRTNLLQWAKRHPKALILTADLTSSCEADLLRDKLPSQYLSMGMAEQNMMSFAGGLAREGYHPYIHTFAVFVTRRPFDQVAMSIGVPNLPVRLLGFLPGLTTPGGVTHQAIDDVTLMRAIPNMRILEVGDATEVQSVLDVAELVPGPVYIRMWRGQVPRLFPKSAPMKFGVVRKLSDGKDIVLITCGLCTEEALKIRSELEQAGVSFHHLHLSTIVPFPVHDVMEAAKATKYGIITMENHSIVGGIGSATAEALAENGIGKNLVRLGVPGVYAHGASCAYLMKEYGYDCTALQQAVEQLVGKRISGRNSFVARVETKKELPVAERPEDL